MKFADALKAATNGAKIRQKDWDSWVYIYIKDGKFLYDTGEQSDINRYIASDNWEICEQTPMSFSKILKLVEPGNVIRREGWRPSKKFMIARDGSIYTSSRQEFTNLHLEDLKSDDWVFVYH